MIDGTGVFLGVLEGESSLVILEVSYLRCFCMSAGCRLG